MGFKYLSGLEIREGIKLVSEILDLILDGEKNLSKLAKLDFLEGNRHYSNILNLFLKSVKDEDYPVSSYTPKRLSIAIQKYKENKSKKDLLKELLSRFYYDSCIKGKRIELEFPPLLQIEIASKCNYKCVFCYQTDMSFSGPNSPYMGFMDFDLFKKIIDQIDGSIPYITFASRGEPTLHPKFEEILDYCKGKFKDIKINTNASALNRKKINKILEVCDTVVFSIDTPDKEIYPKIRVGGKLENVLKNIALFNEIRSTHIRKKDVNTRASGVLFNPNIQSKENYKKLFSPLFDQTAFVKYNPWEKIYSLPENGIETPCQQPFYRFFIWFDGSYNCCDMDYKSILTKDATKISHDFSVKNAWNSQIMKDIREIHHSGKRNSLDPCKRCPIKPS